jgi:uncharacterized protein with PIN domain/S-formylglutathione hydrolase FrmB
MANADIRFYAELRDFLAPEHRSGRISHAVDGPRSVKDVIESYGVPHPEVEVILVDGRSVDFSYRPAPGDHISVYPVFESFDVSPMVRLRPEPLRRTRFVLDGHLGKLARRLRLLGLDCAYATDPTDDELVALAVDEQRIVLTRDRFLLKRKAVTHGYYLRSDEPRRQVREVVRRFQLSGSIKPFTRCVACNGVLAAVDKADIEHRLPPKTRLHYDDFHTCPDCGRDYWRGAHHARLERIVAEARSADDDTWIASVAEVDERHRILTVESESVGTVPVHVLLPSRFHERRDARWPVLYLLHGMWDGPDAWIRETDVVELTVDLDLLVVMPDGGQFGYYTDWWNGGEGGPPMWETFHLVELRQLLEREFRVGPRRVVAGLSMGGFGAMSYAARHPDLFAGAASFSGIVDCLGAPRVPPEIVPGAFGDREEQADVWREHDPLSLADRLRGLALYVSWGNGRPGELDGPGASFDPDEHWIGEGNERFVARLGELGIEVTARGGPGTHVWPYWQRALHEALPLLMEPLGE